jgi:hypothetical protein
MDEAAAWEAPWIRHCPFGLRDSLRMKKNDKHLRLLYISLYISRICGADPTEPIVMIFGTSRDLADLINCAKFDIDRSRG